MLKSRNKHILFLMSGSIAAYKSCHVISQLVQKGHQVQVVTTPSAMNFIGAATLEGLTGRPVVCDLYAPNHMMEHIHLARWADLVILCPATANTINKMAQGIGDDLVTSLFLAHDFKKPFLIAPAMNTAMYEHPLTQASLEKLKALGLKILATGAGALACGEVGAGRLLEPEQIIDCITRELEFLQLTERLESPNSSKTTARKILITSGGTQEPIDAMRVITNLSTGQTGAFLAEVFYDFGFEVFYLGAANGARPQRPCHQLSFKTFNDLNDQVKSLLQSHSFFGVIHAAAVSDFHVSRLTIGDVTSEPVNGKLPSNQKLVIELEPNFKILPRLKSYSMNPALTIVGFKYTATENSEAKTKAVHKLFQEGGVDWVVHNDQADIDKQRGLHRFTLHSQHHSLPLPNKMSLAECLCEKFQISSENREINL
ncbi:MAG: hypothetical protein RJB66_656 [Pseudomonadota bacterium]|jgi:phosphopantothenoylcysteine decarboxylase/phosphopantothenate--cysteine ligase